MRICQVFARRGFNIDSLVVSAGPRPALLPHDHRHHRRPEGLDQIIKQVQQAHRRHPLLRAHAGRLGGQGDGPDQDAQSTPRPRTEALQIVEHFGGKTVDLTATSMIAMITREYRQGRRRHPPVRPFDIIETVRTGKVVMARGEQAT